VGSSATFLESMFISPNSPTSYFASSGWLSSGMAKCFFGVISLRFQFATSTAIALPVGQVLKRRELVFLVVEFDAGITRLGEQ
jgi:hypothetical protein